MTIEQKKAGPPCKKYDKKAHEAAVLALTDATDSNLLIFFDDCGMFTISTRDGVIFLTPGDAEVVAEFIGRISCN